MGCCGSSRRQFHTADQDARRTQGATPQEAAAPASDNSAGAAGNTNGASGSGTVHYEYVGSTSITVRGSATGNIYRFHNYGDRIGVDFQDAPSMDTVPNLRRV